MVSPCTCEHKYQDEKYGKGNRVWNKMKKENMYRCTICKKEKSIST